MTTATHELRLNIDAAAAKRGSRDFTAAIRAVKAAVRDLDRDAAGTFSKLKNIRPQVDVSSITKATTATGKLASASDRAASDIKRTALSAASAWRTSVSQADRLKEKMDRIGDSTGIQKITRDLAQLESRLARASSPMDVRVARSSFADSVSDQMGLNRQLELQERQQNIAATAAASHAAQLENLRAKYNPLYSASAAYAAQLDEIATAERLGAISAGQASAAREQAAQALGRTNVALGKYATNTKASAAQTANLGAQFNDIGVMLAAGQNPLMLAVQQGTQINQIAAQMGGGANALRGMAAGVMSMISPMSLATIGIIAGGAALIQWGVSAMGAEDKGKALEERFNSLKTLSTDLSANIDVLKMTVGELAEKYGSAATRVREFAVIQAGLDIARATAAFAAQSSVLQDSSRAYRSATDSGRNYLNALNHIERDIGLSGQAAREFEKAITDAAYAPTFDQQVAALQIVYRLLKDNGIAASDLPPELAAALSEMISLSAETDAARKTADDLAGAVSEIAPNLSPAVTTAAALKNELAQALALHNRIAAQESKTYSGRGGDPRSFTSGGKNEYGPSNVENHVDIDQFLADARKSAARAAGSSRKSAAPKISDEQKARDRLTESIKEQVQSLKNEANAATLVASGRFATTDAARLWAEVEAQNKGAVDATTAAMIAQIDTMTALRDARASDPIQQYLQQLGTAEERTRNLKATLLQQTEGTLSDIFAGEFDAGQMVGELKRNLAQRLARDVMGKLVPGMSSDIGSSIHQGSQTGAQAMHAAIVSGGSMAAQSMAAALTGAATGGGAGIGQVTQNILAGAGMGAPTASTGGWNPLSLLPMAFGMFQEGGTTNAPPVSSMLASPAAFRNAPHYSEGTANTSGIPAILHDNEAVIPLSKGRKIPVDLGGAAKGEMGDIYAPVISPVVNVSVEGGDGDGMSAEQAKLLGSQITSTVQAVVETQMAKHLRYGGMLKPRGM